MADNAFYVRVRGKISGPFDVPTLQKLVKRGSLSRIHEVSSDRTGWSKAGEFEDLFPTSLLPVVEAPKAPPPEAVEQVLPAQAPQTAVATAPAGALYYYTQRGSTVGPVPMAILKTLVENGTLRSDDLVWRENADTGAPAAQVPALAPLFGELAQGSVIGYRRPRGDRHQLSLLQKAAASAGAQSRTIGIASGIGISVVLNLPWATIDKKLVWWWDVYRVPDGGSWAIFVTFVVVAAVTLTALAPLIRGIARGIVYLSLILAASIFLSVATTAAELPMEKVAALAVPLALALLLGVCAFRASAIKSLAAMVILAVCSGIVSLGTPILLVNSFRDTGSFTAIPAGILFGDALVLIGALAGLACGIMGFVGLKPTFTPQLNLATIVAASAALVLPGVGIFIAVASASDFLGGLAPVRSSEVGGLVVEITGRLLLIGYAWLSVAMVGIWELLAAACSNVATG